MPNSFVLQAQEVLDNVEEWRKTWKHRKPCDEWERNKRMDGVGFCKHYVEARYRKFKDQIDPLFQS